MKSDVDNRGSTVVIVPTYNEAQNIANIIDQIFSVLPESDVVVVDDNSPDGTAGIVKKLTSTYSKLSLYERSKKEGLGVAYIDIFTHVLDNFSYSKIITMDADGSHDPSYLRDLDEHSDSHDVVIGSRYVQGGGVANWNVFRRLISRGGNLYAKLVSGCPVNDMTAGFMCIKTDKLREVDLSGINVEHFAFLIALKYELIKVHGHSFKETPIIFSESTVSTSKFSLKVFTEGFITVIGLLKPRKRKK